jgi:glycosyltransferase involved in cell wall biosynthesis
MRVKIVEGMSVGRAMVSTSIGAEGLPEELPGLHIGDTPDIFAAKIIALLTDHNFANTEGEKAAKSILEAFGAEKVSADFAKFLSQQGLLETISK